MACRSSAPGGTGSISISSRPRSSSACRSRRRSRGTPTPTRGRSRWRSPREVAIQIIETKITAGTFAELPDLHARFAAVDVAPALARTLQIGLIDEFGWPALEEAATELDPEDKGELTFHGAPVAAVVANATK